jgi:hypothetical protein
MKTLQHHPTGNQSCPVAGATAPYSPSLPTGGVVGKEKKGIVLDLPIRNL